MLFRLAHAQEAADAAPPAPTPAAVTADGMAEADRVIVTGSNIPTAAEVGPNPVDTYRRDDITRLGVRTPTDFIQKLPAAFGAGSNQGTTATGDGSATISLRGIDPKETLVLQDGRRLANGGIFGLAIDFNQFPLGLIDHIDVLKDGASPVYGSDAVAGVVNVYLIHKFRGVELYASYGNTNLGSANDMDQEIAYLLAGTGDDKTNLVVFAELFNQGAIFSRDLDISRSLDYRPFGGQDDRSSNFAGHVDGFIYDRSLNGGLKSPTPHSYPNVAGDPQYVPQDSLPPGRQRFNFAQFTPVVASSDREYFYGSFDRQLCGKFLQVFADWEYNRDFWNGSAAPTPLLQDVWTDATHPFGITIGGSGLSVPLQNPFNPFTAPDYISPGGYDPNVPSSQASAAPSGTGFTTGVRYRTLEGGVRTFKTNKDNNLFTGGLRGELGEFGEYFKTWQWEAGVRWNETQRTASFGGQVNNYALRTALLDTNPATAFNPFGLNQNSHQVIDKIIVDTKEAQSTTLLTEDFNVNGDLFQLPAGPASFAVGTQHLTNHTLDQPDGLTASGQISGGTSFSLVKGSRDAWSIFWETRVPVTSPSWNVPGLHSLEFDYAERFESYSDFGETERPKFSIRWQPFGGSPVPVTIRASYIEAFHAPGLVDLFSGVIVGNPNIFDPVIGAISHNVDVIFLSNPNLQPEIAYERTIGAVVTPAAWWKALTGLTLTIDYGHIDLRSFATQLDPQFIVDHESLFPGAVVRDPAAGNQIVRIIDKTLNTGGFVQSYIDYEAMETFETSRLGHGDWGTFTATFNGTYLIDVSLQLFPGEPFQSVVGKFGGGFQGRSGGGSFTHNRWYASLFYDGPASSWVGGIDTGFTVHYIGQYWDSHFFTADLNDRKVREWTTLDFVLNYSFNQRVSPNEKQVPGETRDGKGKNVMPVSTAEYNPCGWRAWLDHTSLSFGVNNVFDLAPPFVAAATMATGAAENGFDEATANGLGRFWYVAVKKRF